MNSDNIKFGRDLLIFGMLVTGFVLILAVTGMNRGESSSSNEREKAYSAKSKKYSRNKRSTRSSAENISQNEPRYANWEELKKLLLDSRDTTDKLNILFSFWGQYPADEKIAAEIGIIYLYELSNSDEAINWLERAVQINPQNYVVFRELANIYADGQKWEVGERFFGKIFSEVQDSRVARAAMGNFFLRKGEPKEALENLQEAAGSVSNPEFLADLALTYSMNGQEAKSIEAYIKAIGEATDEDAAYKNSLKKKLLSKFIKNHYDSEAQKLALDLVLENPGDVSVIEILKKGGVKQMKKQEEYL